MKQKRANKRIYLSEYVRMLLKESVDICISPNHPEPMHIGKNHLVSTAKYSGITPKLADQIHKLCVHDIFNRSKTTRDGIIAAYLYIVSRNPELKAIKLDVPNYYSKRYPMHDIVHGVISGIEPHNIAYFVQDLRGSASNDPRTRTSTKGYVTL